MKKDPSLHTGFTVVFIDILMAILIFFICFIPFSSEGKLDANLPKHDGPHSPISYRNEETKIFVRVDKQAVFIEAEEYYGKNRFRKLQNILQKLVDMSADMTKKMRIILDQNADVPFQSTISFLNTCRSLKEPRVGFIEVAFLPVR